MLHLFQSLIKQKEDKGFTLIELLVTVLIIGVLSAISLPNLLNQVQKAREAEAKNNLGAINRAQQSYRFEKGVFATSLDAIGLDLTVGSYNGSNYETRFYQYSASTANGSIEVHNLAVPQPFYSVELKTIKAAVYMDSVNRTITSVLCQGNAPGDTPVISFNPTTCTDGEIVR